jgi:CBS domain-containing protein
MVRAVVTTSPDTTVEALARLMINLRISGVPVLDKDGRLVGIVSEGDLLRRVEIIDDGDTRLRARRHDAPDGSHDVLAQQLRQDARPINSITIDAGAGPRDCLAAARPALAFRHQIDGGFPRDSAASICSASSRRCSGLSSSPRTLLVLLAVARSV